MAEEATFVPRRTLLIYRNCFGIAAVVRHQNLHIAVPRFRPMVDFYDNDKELAIDIGGPMPHSGRTMCQPQFKDLLRKWRGDRMQKEAAFILGVPVATLRKWEYGKRTPTKLTRCEVERRMQNG